MWEDSSFKARGGSGEGPGDPNRLLKAVMKGAAPRLKPTLTTRPSPNAVAAVQTSATFRTNASSSVTPAPAASVTASRDSKVQTPARGKHSVGALDKLGLISRSTGKPLTPPSRRTSTARSTVGTDEEIVEALRIRQRQLLRQNNHLADLWEEANQHNKALEKTNKRLEQEVSTFARSTLGRARTTTEELRRSCGQVLKLRLELARLRVPNAPPPSAARRASRASSGPKTTSESFTQTSATKTSRQSRGTAVAELSPEIKAAGQVQDAASVRAPAAQGSSSSSKSERAPPPVTQTPRRPVSTHQPGWSRRLNWLLSDADTRTSRQVQGKSFDSLYNLSVRRFSSELATTSPPRHAAPLRTKPKSRREEVSSGQREEEPRTTKRQVAAEEATRPRRAASGVLSYREPR